MTALFSSPKAPVIQQAAPMTEADKAAQTFTAAPTRSAAEVQAEVASDRTRRAARGGRGSTLLTAQNDNAIGDRRKTLLGE